MKAFSILEEQIRECFGRVVYTHKTHEKMADLTSTKLWWLKSAQILFSALTSSGLLATFVVDYNWVKIVTAIVSFITLWFSTYIKDFDLGATAQAHRDAASKIWPIRESYLSLLTDLRMSLISDEDARNRRDKLQEQLSQVYSGAPHTNDKAYSAAQVALKNLEDLTFSDEELNKFLPDSLRKK